MNDCMRDKNDQQQQLSITIFDDFVLIINTFGVIIVRSSLMFEPILLN